MTTTDRYDPELAMYVEPVRSAAPHHLVYLAWLVETGRLDGDDRREIDPPRTTGLVTARSPGGVR